jgi:hypothetical protein
VLSVGCDPCRFAVGGERNFLHGVNVLPDAATARGVAADGAKALTAIMALRPRSIID